MTNRRHVWLLALKPLIRLKLSNYNNFKKYKKGMFSMQRKAWTKDKVYSRWLSPVTIILAVKWRCQESCKIFDSLHSWPLSMVSNTAICHQLLVTATQSWKLWGTDEFYNSSLSMISIDIYCLYLVLSLYHYSLS